MFVQYYLFNGTLKQKNTKPFNGEVPAFTANHKALYPLFCIADVLTSKLLGFAGGRIVWTFLFPFFIVFHSKFGGKAFAVSLY